MKLYNFKLTFLLFVTGIFFNACSSAEKQESHAAIISGNIANHKSGKIYLLSYKSKGDYFLSNLTPIDSAVITKSGDYQFNIKTEDPKVFSISCDKTDLVANLLILPGDQLNISFTGTKNTPFIEPSGKCANFNSYLLKFQDTFYKNPEIKNQYYIASNYMSAEEFETYTDSRKQQMLLFYSEYFGSETPDADYRAFGLNSIHYEFASDRLIYLWKKRMKGEPVQVKPTYLDFATPEFIENKDAFITPSYIRFLNLFLTVTYENKIEQGELPELKSGNAVPQVEKFKLANQVYNGEFRDAVLYSLIMNDMKEFQQHGMFCDVSPACMDTLIAAFKSKYNISK